MKLALFAAAVVALTSTSITSADTYSCEDPPDKRAKVGVSSASTVSITQDKSAKECRMSVNGATVGSPPQDQVLNAINRFRAQGEALREIQGRGIEGYLTSLGLVLMASAPVSQVPQDVVRELQNARRTLDECFRRLGESTSITTRRWDGNVACRVFQPPRNEAEARDLDRSFGVAISSPTIEISVKWDGDRYLSRVYFPRLMFNLPPFR